MRRRNPVIAFPAKLHRPKLPRIVILPRPDAFNRIFRQRYGNQALAVKPPAGTILPRAGVWMMPDNQSPGILENFLRFLVPTPNALFEHAVASVNGIPPEELRFRAVDTPKALIHTWLAWTETPGRPFGTAITARFLDPVVRQAAVCAEWLQSLFFGDGEMG